MPGTPSYWKCPRSLRARASAWAPIGSCRTRIIQSFKVCGARVRRLFAVFAFSAHQPQRDRARCSVTPTIEQHVNGSVELFADFLVLYETYRREVIGMDEADIGERIDRLEAQMRSVDPSAVEGPDSFWSVILEQLREGQL